MSLVALIWGICCFFGFCVALIPCLGWANWINIPLALLGAVFSIVAMARDNKSGVPTKAIIGLTLNAIAGFLGAIRLVLGGGVV